MDYIKVAEIENENVMVDILAAWFTEYNWPLGCWEDETLIVTYDENDYYSVFI